MVDKIKKHKPVSLGTFKNEKDIELIKQFDNYIKLCNRNKNSNNFRSRLGFIRNAIKEELKGKILNNDYINLPKPYYFNLNELKENGFVKASSVKPIYELENTYVFFNVPNNLDSWSEEHNNYCYENNKDLHEGYVKEYGLKLELVFRYNSNNGTVEIAVSNDRDIYFSHEQKEEKSKVGNVTIFDVESHKISVKELDFDLYMESRGILLPDSLDLCKYKDYKYYDLEFDERIKEEIELNEEIERQEEEFYKNQ